MNTQSMKFWDKLDSKYIQGLPEVRVWNQDDGWGWVPAWGPEKVPKEGIAYRPADGDSHEYKAKVIVHYEGTDSNGKHVNTFESHEIEHLKDKGQYILVLPDPGNGFWHFILEKHMD